MRHSYQMESDFAGRGLLFLAARRIGRGETIARNLPHLLNFLEYEEFLVRLRAALTGRMHLHGSRRIGAGHRPLRGKLADLFNLKLNRQPDRGEDCVISLADCFRSNAGRKVLRHENTIDCIQLYGSFAVGSI